MQTHRKVRILALVAVLCALAPIYAAGVKVDNSFTLYAKPKPAGDYEEAGKEVLADGGYYQFAVTVHPDYATKWELVTTTIKWTGPDANFSGSDRSTSATWQSPNDGNTYTVSVTGQLKRIEPQPGPGDPMTFDSKSVGVIYKPVIFWTSPTADIYLPEQTDTYVGYSVEFWAKRGGTQKAIDSSDMTMRYDLQGGDLGGELTGAQFDNGGDSKEMQNVGPTGSGITAQVTTEATWGDQYRLSAQLWMGGHQNATIESDSLSKTIFIVAVDKIQWKEDGEWADVSGTLYVRKDASLNFKAIIKPEGSQWPEDKPVWGGTAGATGTEETSTATFSTTSSTATDYKTVTAECGNTITWNVVVCEIDRVQYKIAQGAYQDFTTTLYLPKGTALDFKAIIKPEGATWPTDKPVWGGTAGATGTEETSSATFSTTSSTATDYKTVTAECGNTIVCNVIVVAVASLTPSAGTEFDDGDGQADTKAYYIEVTGTGNLTVNATSAPGGIDESDLPSAWSLTGGTGQGKLSRTVSRTLPSRYTITCTCGTSTKTTVVYVVRCRFVAFAHRVGVGHSWWKLTLSPSSATALMTTGERLWLGVETGYFPANGMPVDTGVVRIGSQGVASGTHFWNISLTQLKAALAYVAGLAANPGTYNVGGHNCTAEVIVTASSAGVTIPAMTDPETLEEWLNRQ